MKLAIQQKIDECREQHSSTLFLRGMGLSEIPSEVFELTNLTQLSLANNQLSTLPESIIELTNLQGLSLDNNQLSTLPESITKLTNLTQLWLSNNQLSTLPESISKLTNLTQLSLANNQLSMLPESIIELTNLQGLRLYNNQLSALPESITKLSNLQELRLENNPLISPPLEIANRSVKAIQQYFASLDDESQILNEVKVLLVGEGSAGKTSLTRRVLGEAFDANEPTTHGIRIRDWTVVRDDRKFKVNIWDFGGQEIMHATHQFFLSKRSLYILVLDGRRDEKPEYWLRLIESFGGDSPVLIVLNKSDVNPAFRINHPFLQEKYPSIKGVFRTSCATGEGIQAFKDVLTQEFARVELIGIRWSNSWFQVKKRLEKLDEHYISYEQYEAICNEAEISESVSQNVLVDFLNDLGVIVHFRDFELEDLHVLDPKWVTEAVYKIINTQKVANNNGALRLSDLGAILQKQSDEDYFYSRGKHKYIIALMKKFELCYSLDEKRMLIPQLLDVVEPAFEFDYAGSLKFVLQYEDLLPLSIMPRFIVKRHQDIEGELRWRTGVVLANSDFQSIAVVRADNQARRIDIYITGPQRKDYLAVILLFLREINDSFEKLNVDERVPMPDVPNVTASYQTLLNYAQNDLDTYIPDGTTKPYKVSDLLGLVQQNDGNELREILTILHQLDNKKITDKKSFFAAANRIIDLKPNIGGWGININEFLETLYQTYIGRETDDRERSA